MTNGPQLGGSHHGRRLDGSPIVGNDKGMIASLTGYWEDFINQMIQTGRYSNRSEVIRAGLRSLEEQELARETQTFERVFAGGHPREPDDKTIGRMVARQKSLRKKRR